MKKQIKTLTIVFAGVALTLGLALTSCAKAEKGPAGADGKAGTNGTANIQTYTVNVTNSNWIFDNTDNTFNADLTLGSINSSVVDRGTVQVFIDGGSGMWIAVPIIQGMDQFNFAYELGKVLVVYGLSDSSIPSNPGAMTFKVVVIPPAMMKPGVKFNTYDELKTAYNLTD